MLVMIYIFQMYFVKNLLNFLTCSLTRNEIYVVIYKNKVHHILKTILDRKYLNIIIIIFVFQNKLNINI